MRALILAGGKGTRLRPLTVYTPKPIVPVVNRPFLTYQIGILAAAGITDITLSLSYQPDKIESILGDGSELGVKLSYVTEPSPMGTGGAYRFASGSVRDRTIVFNGDILTDVDIATMLEQHSKCGCAATLALVSVPDPSAYGLIESDAENRIVGFIEKPSPEQLLTLTTKTINAGIYILEPEILDLIPENENFSFEYNVFPAILKKRLDFRSFLLDEYYWRDIGTPASYLTAHHDFLIGKLPSLMPETIEKADVATAAQVDKLSVLGNGCVIKPHARVVNSVLGPGVLVDEKAAIENSVIWSHTRISQGAEIKDAVIGRSCYLGRNSHVGPGVVLGDKATIPDYSKI